MKAITSKKYLVPFILITSLFFLWGFARSILDVLNKHFQETLDLGITESALIQVTTYMAYFLMSVPAGIFIMRRGYRSGVVFGLSLFAVGAFLFLPASEMNSLYPFLGALFILACGLAFLETSANPYSSELGPKETTSTRLNLSQSFNGIGSFLAPYLVGSYLFSGGNVSLPYVVMGCVVVVAAVIFMFVQLPEIKHDEEENPVTVTEGNPYKRLFGNSLFVLGLAALLAYEVGEISINSYFVQFTTGQGWLSADDAVLILSAALLIFTVGRFVCSWIMCFVKAETVLLVCAVGTIVCMSLVICNIEKVSLYALVANYGFESIMFPTIFSLAVRGLGDLTKTASSLLMMTPVGGCAFLLVGYIADKVDLVVPFIIPLIAFTVVLVFAYRLLAQNRRKDRMLQA